MEKNLEHEDANKKFKALIEDVNICMLLTFGNDGKHSARPMATIQVDEDATVWFYTGKASHKVEEINRLRAVHLIYSHPGKDSYLDIWGNAELVEDREQIKKLWNPIVKAWFPEGPEDPNLVLMKVSPVKAFYWDNTNSRMVEGFKIIASLVTGKRLDQGDEGALNLN